MITLKNFIDNKIINNEAINEAINESRNTYIALPKFSNKSSKFVQFLDSELKKIITKMNNSVNFNNMLQDFMTREKIESYYDICKDTPVHVQYKKFEEAAKELIVALEDNSELGKNKQNIEVLNRAVSEIEMIVNVMEKNLGEEILNKINQEPYIELESKYQFDIFIDDMDDNDVESLKDLFRTDKQLLKFPKMSINVKEDLIRIKFDK